MSLVSNVAESGFVLSKKMSCPARNGGKHSDKGLSCWTKSPVQTQWILSVFVSNRIGTIWLRWTAGNGPGNRPLEGTLRFSGNRKSNEIFNAKSMIRSCPGMLGIGANGMTFSNQAT